MDISTSVHASDVDPDTLRQMLAEQAASEQAKVFRNLLLRRLGLIALVVWVLSWPAHLLPHIALWVALAIVALAVVLTAPPPQSTA